MPLSRPARLSTMVGQRPRRSVARGVIGACALALALSTAAAAPAVAAEAPRYVALGDSYAAGPLIPVQKGLPSGCLRSTRSYPSVVARSIGATSFRDVTCSAAVSDDLSRHQLVLGGKNGPQFDALQRDTDVVTLTIGGNDIGFAGIVADCAVRSPAKPRGAACKDHYTAGGTDRLAARIDAVAPKIAAVLTEIERRSPEAAVLVTGYPAILPDTGPGCYPHIPFTAGDVAYLRDTEKRLNAMLAGETAAAGLTYVDVYGATVGHDICTPPGTRWIEGLLPTSPALSVHPNAAGMAAMAGAVVAALDGAAVAAA